MTISLILILLVGSFSIYKQVKELLKLIRLKENDKLKATSFFILITLILVTTLVYFEYRN